ncbi:MAG: beta-propeller domain-containing protein, partial [Candidatus Anstonellales archaeon]
GKLKILGYSDYLHPINDRLLLGIGKNTVEADEGDFAWYQGLKIAIFDVSDYNNPKELSYLEIGDRGTESEVLTNHKAFLYDERNNLIVLPVLLAEIDEFKYSGNVHKWEYGDYTFQGVYVVQITKDNKLRVKGRITHFEDDQYFKEARYYYSPKGEEIKRALYINDYLYTISDKIVKINRINDLAEVKKIVLLN